MIGKRLLRLIGIGRPTPKTTLGKAYRWLDRGVTILAIPYVFLMIFPQPLFAHSMEHDGITLYARSEIPKEATATLGHVVEQLSECPLYTEGTPFRVFICDSPWLYTFFSPINGDNFAISSPVRDNIFVAKADLQLDRCYRSKGKIERSFHSVATHEIVHGLIRQRVGRLQAYRMPRWINEGYCEYIAGESTLSDEEGTGMLLRGEHNDSGALRYFRWRKMVEYLVVSRGLSADELFAFQEDREMTEKEMLQWLRETSASSIEL